MKINIRFLFVFLPVMAAEVLAIGGTPPKISYTSVPISQPYVAITFQDGPSSMLTPQVLKILAERKVRATFFVVGENALSHPDIIKQEIAAGHEIGSRSWTHSLFSNQTDQQLLADLQRTDLAIRTATGNSPRYFSPFDTTFTDVQCDTVYKQLGYKVIYWSVDSLAVKDKTAAAIVSSVVSQAKPGAIIMSSDIDTNSVAALPQVIDTLTAKGYRFVTVSDLISMTTAAGQKKFPPIAAASRPPSTTGVSPGYTPAPTSTTTSGGFHPFGTASPGGTDTVVPDPDAPNAGH